ncbi:MAG: TIGR04255 family protein [Candidatus Obscuribacterales bacterium]|nr:TIGR04255 family protein [Candidatus Obscuribacterales bacterium]
MNRKLKKKPIVEAFLDIRWQIKKSEDGLTVDETYNRRFPNFFSLFFPDYPYNEILPASQIPDQLAGYVVKHRLRKGEGLYPLVQLGPGIASFNMGENYEWPEFERAGKDFIKKLLDIAPETTQPVPYNSVLFRCCNAIEVEPDMGDFLEIVKSKLNTSLDLPQQITGPSKSERCSGLNIEFARKIENPAGIASLKISSGYKEKKPAMIWEITVNSIGSDVPQSLDDFKIWLDHAHQEVEDWFFALIEGELCEYFGVDQ